MNFVTKILVILMFFATSHSFAEVSLPAAYLTSKIKQGSCSIKNGDWCPTHADDTKTGFFVHAKSESVIDLTLHYKDLDVACLIWTTAGGKSQSTAQLEITDKSGRTVVMLRNC